MKRYELMNKPLLIDYLNSKGIKHELAGKYTVYVELRDDNHLFEMGQDFENRLRDMGAQFDLLEMKRL